MVEVDVARVGHIKALVDTGACLTMIREKEVPSALRASIRPWTQGALSGAGDGAILPVGVLNLTVRYKACVVDVSEVAVVAACPYQMLLGRDFLKKAGAVVNCKTGELVCDATPMVQPSRPVASLRSGGTPLEDIVECIEPNETPAAPEDARSVEPFFSFPFNSSPRPLRRAAACVATGRRHLHATTQGRS